MLSRPGTFRTLTLALASAVLLASQALAQTTLTLTATPAQINARTFPAGPAQQFDTTIAIVNSSGQPVSGLGLQPAVTISSTVNGLQWLRVGTITGSSTTAGTYNVPIIIDPTGGLPAGNYTGRVDVTAAGTSSTVQIPVNLTVVAANSLAVDPTSLTFTYQFGSGIVPAAQNFNILPNGSALPFSTATFVNTSGSSVFVPNFLTATPVTGTTNTTTPTPVAVSLIQSAVQGLPIGTYAGVVRVSSASTNPPFVDVPVTLNIVNNPAVSFSTQQLIFNVTPGSTSQPQTIFFSSPNGVAANFTATAINPNGLSILSVTPATGTTPGTVAVTANTANLAPGTYTGTVRVAVAGAFNNPQDIPVVINVSSNSQVTATPSQVNFAYQTGTSIFPAAQTVSLAGTLPNTSTSFQIAVQGGTVNGQQFLTVTPNGGTTPGNITIALNQTVVQTLSPGTYTATVQVTNSSQTSPFASLSIPVILTVSANPQVTVTPSSLSFAYQTFTTPPSAQTLTIGTTGTALSYSITVTQPGNLPATVPAGTSIINVIPTTGTVSSSQPSAVSVSINPQFLTDGVYTGFITVTSSGASNSPVIVPVSIAVVTSASLNIGPGPFPLVFRQVSGGTAPTAQNITLTSSGVPLNYAISTNVLSSAGCGNFGITASPSSGIASAGAGTTVAIGVTGTNSLSTTTTCTGSLIVTSNLPGSTATTTQIVPVQFILSPSATLSVASQNVNFSFVTGGPAPQAQKIAITASNNANIALAATASVASPTGGNWLQVGLDSSTTPANLTITANPANLAPGTYTGTVTVTSPGANNSPQVINVTLVVQAVATGVITGVTNAASFQSGVLSPGEVISIFGANLGPTAPVGLTNASVANGSLPTTLGGVTVTFDGVAAPLSYVAAGQINAVVPYEVAGKTSTVVQVTYNGVNSSTLRFNVSTVTPALFTALTSGTGPAAALNQDSSANSANNRAARNSVIQLFGTGEGQTNPGGVTGRITGSTLPRPVLPVLVRIGGIIATVDYAGEAPGLVAGVLQVNARIPSGVIPNADGTVPVEINVGGTVQNGQIVGGTFSQSNVTIYVQ